MAYPFELNDGKIVDICKKCLDEFILKYDDEKEECIILKSCKCGKCDG